jgi:Tfp pilus assembly ATPase PilU
MEELETVLGSAFVDGASDVIYQVGHPVMKKIQGRLIPYSNYINTVADTNEVIRNVAGDKFFSGTPRPITG